MKKVGKTIFALGCALLLLLVSNTIPYDGSALDRGLGQSGDWLDQSTGDSSSSDQEVRENDSDHSLRLSGSNPALGASPLLALPAAAPVSGNLVTVDLVSLDGSRTNGFDVSESIHIVISFSFDLQGMTIQTGDKVVFSIDPTDKKLVLLDSLGDIDVINFEDNNRVIGKAVVDRDNDCVELVYNDDAENNTDLTRISGQLRIGANFNYNYFSQTNNQTINEQYPFAFTYSWSGGSVDLTPLEKTVHFYPKVDNGSLEKSIYTSGRHTENGVIEWYTTINFHQIALRNAVLLDYLDSEPGGTAQNHKLLRDSIRIYEVEDLYIDGWYFKGKLTDVTSQYTIQRDTYKFRVDFGTINKPYYVTYSTQAVTPGHEERYNRSELEVNGQSDYAWWRNKVTLTGSAIGSVEYKAQLTVTKVDEAGTPLPNAKFDLLNQDGTVVATLYTDHNGQATAYALKEGGAYTLRETQSPGANYLPIEDITIPSLDLNHRERVVNEKVPATGALEIRKFDKEGNFRLSGATFMLFQDAQLNQAVGDDAGNFSWTTGTSSYEPGSVRIYGLAPGAYYLLETKAPEGYRASTEPVRVEIRSSATTYQTIHNERDALKLRIVKEDDSYNKLTGANFTAYRKAPTGYYTEILTFDIADKAGYVYDSAIVGEYLLWENKAPDDYQPNYESLSFTITEEDRERGEYIHIVENIREGDTAPSRAAARVLSHVEGDESAGIEGAELKLEKATAGGGWEPLVNYFVTGQNGLSGVIWLPEGTYRTTLLASPFGYKSTGANVIEYTITAADTRSNASIVIPIPHQVKNASLVISKVDHSDGSKPLSGAIFTLQAEDGSDVFVGRATDSNGQISVPSLPYGNYTLWELDAPSGYATQGGSTLINVNEDRVHVTIENEKATGENTADVTLIKHAAGNTATTLSGAQFDLEYVNASGSWATFNHGYQTDLRGQIEIHNLPRDMTYRFRETAAPSGYSIDSAITEFSLSSGSTTLYVANSRFSSNNSTGSGGGGGRNRIDGDRAGAGNSTASNPTAQSSSASDQDSPEPTINPETGAPSLCVCLLYALAIGMIAVGGSMMLLWARKDW